MTTQYVPLSTLKLQKGIQIVQTHQLPELVYVDDPATYVVYDFLYQQPSIVNAKSTVEKIKNGLKTNHLHELLVMENNRLKGILEVGDIVGSKATKAAQEAHIDYQEVMAEMLMTPCHDILTLNYDDLVHAKVGNVAVTLKQQKANYAIVVEVEKETEEQTLRGLISGNTMKEQLGKKFASLLK